MKLRHILGAIQKADTDFGMIEDGDKIAVAFSGGKDSMLLFLALSIYQKYKTKHFSLCGIHVDVGFENFDHQPMIDFAEQYNLDLIIDQTRIYEILKKHPNPRGQIQCSLCSNLKKGDLFRAAKANGCNKVAFGHHGDDAVETLFMNMMYGSRIATFQPKQYMSRQQMDLIRPMIYLKEQDIIEACRKNHITGVRRVCPNDGFTRRQYIKEKLNAFYAENPEAHDNFISSLSNIDQIELWKSSAK
ncbi:tRNA 2-thiocytidine biosynthesis TtcA family protein [Catenisphaera adipataccumulans]|jgi:tRNA 2-thiocytidine biosynthesis protein TtcA|uniref:tRNA(Ile)-lysidine synthase TilS/MesJ n=1 Tax=Catenisphaera adipataccumulans TaxID=700500 RepID=A0A7W8CXZ8_9FIRM|nr:ATP-binding protein [Catenisphaera adipataccumulans]MBB5183687.1 tRNA(Ile)-lysidine synthase TilS/MesJ [Catenisphaera adipataccumulans]